MTVPILHGGGLARAAALFGGAVSAWLDLSTGINPCPQPLPAIPASAWQRLPDADLVLDARRAAAAFYGTGEHMPLAVPGTQSVIQHLPDLVTADRPVAILSPTYGEYEHVLRAAGRRVEAIGRLEEIRADHGMVVVVNPNNPTGRIVPPADLKATADRMAGQGGRLVVDEAFADGVPGASLAPLAATHPGLVVFRSFGKVFGLAGLRLGFVVAEPSVLATLEAALGPWAVSGPALVIASALFRGDTAALYKTIAERKAALETILRRADLRILGGTPLFALVEVQDARQMQAVLCTRRILTRAFPYSDRWLRIGLTPDDIADARLSDALVRAQA